MILTVYDIQLVLVQNDDQITILHQSHNEKLKGIDRKEYNFNYGYLVKHDLVDGQIHHSSNGAECFTPNGGITGTGMDIVEKFINESIEKVENKIIDKTHSHLDKIVELATIWNSNLDLYQQAWELLSSLISNLHI